MDRQTNQASSCTTLIATNEACAQQTPRATQTATLSDTSPAFEVPPNLITTDCAGITPEMLTLVQLEPEQIAEILRTVPGGVANVQDIFPLTPLQESLLFHYLRDDRQREAYILLTLLSLSSRRRLEELIAALNVLIERHPALRTAILWERLANPVQVVYRHALLPVQELTLRDDRDPIAQAEAWMQAEPLRVDLRQAPLARLTVARDPNSEQWFALLQLHHVAGDNLQQDVVISEVVAQLSGRALAPPPPPLYRNHLAHLRAYATRRDADTFFRAKLDGVYEPTAPFDVLAVDGNSSNLQEAHQELPRDLVLRARNQARRLGVSAAALFHSAFALVLAHTSQREDVVFGTVVHGRLHGDFAAKRILGMVINTLPLRLNLADISSEDLIRHTQRELVDLLDYEHASLSSVQRISGSEPLFTALINYRHRDLRTEARWSDAAGVHVLARRDRTHYPVTLTIDEHGDHISITAQTGDRIDARHIATYLRESFSSLIDALETGTKRPALSLPMLPPEECQDVTYRLNATIAQYQTMKLIHQLFEDEVSQHPSDLAVVHHGMSLTYSELNRQANQLARYLRAEQVGPDNLVAVFLERGLPMVVGLLGILKAGGAYLPLDPNYPSERLAYMVQDATPRLILTQASLATALPETKTPVILIDSHRDDRASEAEQNLSNLEVEIHSHQLVYVIYTSGSTGKPKGVAMSHGAMVNLVEWHRDQLSAVGGTRVLQFAALSFDVAFQEIFSTLCTGGTLVLLDEWERKDAQALVDVLTKHEVQRLFVPPVMLEILAYVLVDANLPCLRDVITAGEQLRITPEIMRLFQRLRGCRLHNHYGPTETHVVTTLTLSGDPNTWPTLPTIGRPIANTQIYLLDRQRNPVPLGVSGEIHIGGANVARGYLERPDLTAERFLSDALSNRPDARMYKTGDLGRLHHDGTIEYLGRNDNQVKIRGFRVEPAEIEGRLLKLAQIRSAAVVACTDAMGANRLVAYVTLRTPSEFDSDQLSASLRNELPEHMVPSAYVVLDSLPLTPTGKVNRRALPTSDLAVRSKSGPRQSGKKS